MSELKEGAMNKAGNHERVVAITASRDGVTREQVQDEFQKMVDNDWIPDCMVFGGAQGGDTIALNAAGRLLPSVYKIVIVPCRLTDQPEEAIRAVRGHTDKVIELRHRDFPEPATFHQRNQVMVHMSTHVIAFYGHNDQSKKNKGGTGGTALHAEACHKKVKRIFQK